MNPSALTDYGISEERHSEYNRPIILRAREGTIRGTPEWLNNILDDLATLLRLPSNWDHYGARPVDPQSALATARFLLAVLREDSLLPKLVPTVGGNIQLEWHTDAADLEIEVRPQGPSGAYFFDRRTGEEWEEVTTADLTSIVNRIVALS